MGETMAVPTPLSVAIDPELARRRQARRRTFVVLASISVGWKVVLFTLGAAVPRWLIADGVSELPTSHQAYGAASLATARALYDTPVERYGRVVQRVRVMSVEPTASHAGGTTDAGCGVGARVRAYTYFAIPYSEVRTRCARGVIEYRVFRPRARAD